MSETINHNWIRYRIVSRAHLQTIINTNCPSITLKLGTLYAQKMCHTMKIYSDAFYFKFMKNEYIDRTKIEKWFGCTKKAKTIIPKSVHVMNNTQKKIIFRRIVLHLRKSNTLENWNI